MTDAPPVIRLRSVEPDDLDVYVRMRCDPVMMVHLGGPLPREGIAAKVARDVAAVRAGTDWIFMVLVGEGDAAEAVAGTVVLWSHDGRGERLSEIGWMILPEYQGRGIGKAATAMLLEKARQTGQWGPIHAFSGVENEPSNGICRSLGFELLGESEGDFNGRTLRVNHWRLEG